MAFNRPPSGRKLSKQQEALKATIAEANAKANEVSAVASVPDEKGAGDGVLLRALKSVESPEKVKVSVDTVNVDLIDMNPTPQRRFYPEWTLRSIAHSLKRTGQRDPIHVYPNPDHPGRYITTDGWTRVLAIRQFGEEMGLSKDVLIKILWDLTPLEAAMYGFFQNKDRHGTADLDDAFYFQDLMEVYKVSRAEIMKFAEISNKGAMSQLMSFTALDPSLIELINPHKYRFSKNFAYLVLRIQERHGLEKALEATKDVIGKPVKAVALDAELAEEEEVPEEQVKYKGISIEKLNKRLQELDTLAALGSAPGKVKVTKPVPGHHVINESCVIKHKAGAVGIEMKTRKMKPEVREQLLQEVEAVLRKYFPSPTA